MRNLSGGGLAVTRGHCSQAPLSPSNFARNSSVACSNIEFISLELQCFREVSKNDRGKLCATFAGVVIAVTLDPLLATLYRSRALWSCPAATEQFRMQFL